MNISMLEPMPLNILHRELDWPIVPDNICQEIIDSVLSGKLENIREIDSPTTNAPFVMYPITDSFIEWAKVNLPFIPDDYKKRIQRIYCPLSPHIDHLRTCSYNFVLTTEGSTTNWHNNDLSILETFNYKPRTWYQHQSQIKHSVVGSSAIRIAICIFKFELQIRDWNKDFTGNVNDSEAVRNFMNEKKKGMG